MESGVHALHKADFYKNRSLQVSHYRKLRIEIVSLKVLLAANAQL